MTISIMRLRSSLYILTLSASLLSVSVITGCKPPNRTDANGGGPSGPPNRTVPTPPGICAQIGGDQNKCGERIDCEWKSGLCQAATDPNDCGNVTDKDLCDSTFGATSTYKCTWETSSGLCVKSTTSSTTIYTWKAIELPENVGINDITHFTASRLGHLYAYSDNEDEKGLYYSDNHDANWGRSLMEMGGEMVPEAKRVSLDTAKGGIDQIKPTSIGAVVRQGKKLAILEGDKVKMVLDTSVNNNDSTEEHDKLPGGLDAEIGFIDVVFTATSGEKLGETLIFGLKDEPNRVFLHSTTGDWDKAPRRLEVKPGGEEGDDDPLVGEVVFLAAGNSAITDNLLLGSKDGVYEMPIGNTYVFSETTPVDLGKLDSTKAQPVIKPEGGKAWTPDNTSIKVVGSFNNGGTAHYFAGLGANGGLAHHKGPMSGEMDNDAALSFKDHSILAVKPYNNGHVLVTEKAGILGVNTDGTPNTANDISPLKFANDKNEMMEGSKEQLNFKKGEEGTEFSEEEGNRLVRDIFVHGADIILWIAENGIYLRTKTTGKPRPDTGVEKSDEEGSDEEGSDEEGSDEEGGPELPEL